MKKSVLLVTSSLFGNDSKSTQLAESLIERLGTRYGDLAVRRRNLDPASVPHLDEQGFGALSQAPESRSIAQQVAAERSQRYIDELEAADLVVLAVPMYNFSVPSTFKAWFDHLARAGLTFEYTAQGPRGLLSDRPVYVVSTRGGRHAGTPQDFVTPYLKQILNFIGLTSIEFIHAEGLGSSAGREAGMAAARDRILALAA